MGDIKRRVVILVVMVMSLTGMMGCEISTENNCSPENILKRSSDLDLFVVNNVVYVNASEVEWAKELELTKSDILGKINKTGVRQNFTDWNATKLEVDTCIYSTEEREDLVLVEVGDRLVPYLKYVEG